MRRSHRLVALVIGVVSLGAFRTNALAVTDISLDTYVARLSAVQIPLAALPPGAGASDITAALAPLGLPVEIDIPGSGRILVTQDSLLGTLNSGPSAATTASGRVGAALEAARVATAAEPPDLAGLKAALDKAYLGQTSVGPSLIDRVLADIFQALGWLLDRTLGAMARSGIGALIGWLVVAAILVFVWRVVVRVRGTTVAEGRVAVPSGHARSVDWRRVADDALAAGDLSEAVRALYHLLLATLAARGVVHDAASLTAGECRRAVRSQRPALAPAVDAATRSFERVVFGRMAADEDDIAALRAAERAVQRG